MLEKGKYRALTEHIALNSGEESGWKIGVRLPVGEHQTGKGAEARKGRRSQR